MVTRSTPEDGKTVTIVVTFIDHTEQDFLIKQSGDWRRSKEHEMLIIRPEGTGNGRYEIPLTSILYYKIDIREINPACPVHGDRSWSLCADGGHQWDLIKGHCIKCGDPVPEGGIPAILDSERVVGASAGEGKSR